MIKIYTTPSCSSCRKAKKWLDDHNVEYKEVNLFNTKITDQDLNFMLQNADNGFDDIVSTRSKVFKEQGLNVDDMSISELKQFIIDNPSVLRRPIIVGNDRMQVGYNDDDIRVFVPKKIRELMMCTDCKDDSDCDYRKTIEKYFKEIGIENKNI